jgi:hypothetical protein
MYSVPKPVMVFAIRPPRPPALQQQGVIDRKGYNFVRSRCVRRPSPRHPTVQPR